jgi:hypothetical protein
MHDATVVKTFLLGLAKGDDVRLRDVYVLSVFACRDVYAPVFRFEKARTGAQLLDSDFEALVLPVQMSSMPVPTLGHFTEDPVAEGPSGVHNN